MGVYDPIKSKFILFFCDTQNILQSEYQQDKFLILDKKYHLKGVT